MSPGSRWMDFNYDAYGEQGPAGSNWYSGFGTHDLAAAQSQGYSNAQIRILAQRAIQQGRTVGPAMRSWIDANTQQGPWDYGGIGGAEFGKADLQQAIMGGSTWKDIQGYTDYANQHGIGVDPKAMSWLTDNKDNPAYMSWTDQKAYHKQQEDERRAYMEQQTREAESRAKVEWERQQAEHKRMNPRMAASNSAMKAGSAGGVRSKRSSEWEAAGKEGGGNRGTSSLGRGLLIGGLNI